MSRLGIVASPASHRPRRTPRRATRGTREVLEALDHREIPATAQDLFIELREHGHRIGLATVYRALHVLREQGLLHVFSARDGTAFRACSYEPHHHLVCLRCGRVQEEHVGDLASWLAEVERGGFRIDTCSVEVLGVCHRCGSPTGGRRVDTGPSEPGREGKSSTPASPVAALPNMQS
jgi:Fur family ferric uptake transcriptional regulator